MSDNKPSSPVHIRVPLNTHPSHLNTPSSRYGAVMDDNNSSYYYSAAGDSVNSTPVGSPSLSLRGQIESFAGSYSRTSALYMAENLSITNRLGNSNPPTHHGEDDVESLNNSQHEENIKSKLVPIEYTLTQTLSQQAGYHLFPSLSRHTTVASVISQQFNSTQQQHDPHYTASPIRSTFMQSIFNSINVLVGIGVLALPLGFRCAGWFFGSCIFFFCTFATNYTAKLIAKCLDFYPNSTTYGDMGAAAFGDRGRTFVSTIFVVELMTIGVAMVVLLGDGIESLFPNVEMFTIRVGSFLVLTPMLFLPIRKLAYTSLIGIISCACLVTIVLYDGFSKKTKPGSLIEPMETEIFPSEIYNIPLSFGLMMAGFAGHAVFPAIYRDMEEPKRYERMVDITYLITVAVYITMAIAGYAMFGLETMQEITQNLATTPGYSKWINRLAIWLIVLTPLAKYGLMMNPVSVTWELWITSYANVELWCKYHSWRKPFLAGVGRILASAIVIMVATVFPGFDRIMSLLGALFSFGISAIFPLVCYVKLFHQDLTLKDNVLIYSILTVSIIMATFGTIWSFLPNNL
ncbi:transmembrane amino acid transporter protein-domain-containing protein [Helicostylum pulchrum]|nr:transmembrane amino acid transporter protein-domain-containing protein [Helicostylum pulchrum]